MKPAKKYLKKRAKWGSFRELPDSTKSVIILVSGLPRSGTSMMMQMLEAGGIEVVVDDIRKADQDNLKGYYELEKIKRVITPDLTILTVDALTGNDAVMQAEEFHKRIGIDGTILTKVDADVKGGSALSVTYVTGKPIVFIGTGQKYEDLKEFKPEQFTEMILK